jgi:GntR family transcriptional regulator
MSTAMSDWNDAQPIYRQLKEKLMNLILDGDIKEGDAMPSVRQISLELKINPLTVSRAVQELEDDGALEKRRGLGTFVRDGAREQLRAKERDRFMEEDWPQIAARLNRLQIHVSDLFSGGNTK